MEQPHPYREDALNRPVGPIHEESMDPANQMLSDALRKSFGVLKMMMLVLVVLYFLSGIFRVEPNEVGVRLLYGQIVGADPESDGAQAVLPPSWYLWLPYPFGSYITIPTSERELPVAFMFELSDEEKATGISGYRFDRLSPRRDDYLITGDVNVLHAALTVKYKITDAIAYLRNVHPTPDPRATARSEEFRRYPENAMLKRLVRDAVIEAAASQEALAIRGPKQDEFLMAVGREINERLDALAAAGLPLGISVDASSGVLAPKSGGTVEAIMPPRQVQREFDQVFAAQTDKSATIIKADAEARQRLLKTAGPDYEPIYEAIETEYAALLALNAAQDRSTSTAAGDGASSDGLAALQERLAAATRQVESLLRNKASGEASAIVRDAEIARDRTVKTADADYRRYARLLPQFLEQPEVFLSRLRDEAYARALDSKDVGKVFVPTRGADGRGGRIWLKIPRSGEVTTEEKPGEKEDTSEARERGKKPSVKPRPQPVL